MNCASPLGRRRAGAFTPSPITGFDVVSTFCDKGNNSGGRNSDSAWAKMYDLIPRSLKSHKFEENYQESDFHAGNGGPLGILFCIN